MKMFYVKQMIGEIMLNKNIDFHVHSDYSYDGKQSIDMICKDMISKGVSAVCLTEHVDIGHPDVECQPLPDWNNWNNEIDKIKEYYPLITLYKGVELGDNPLCRDEIKNYIANKKFDYILLSLHLVNNMDPYNRDQFFKNQTRNECYLKYLQSIYDEVNHYTDYDGLAHIGYISRYAPWINEKKPLLYEDGKELLDEIMKILIKKDKCLEINTKGPKDGKSCPDISIIKRYIELGGKLFIFGSDGHTVSENYYRINETRNIVKELGGQYQSIYKNRELVTMPL